jgi:phage terminase small subunit
MRSKLAALQPPRHLRSDTAVWFTSALKEYELDSHHVRLLTKACEAWDRSEQAREAIAKHGLTYTDRFNSPRSRPECAIERDSRLAFAGLFVNSDLTLRSLSNLVHLR